MVVYHFSKKYTRVSEKARYFTRKTVRDKHESLSKRIAIDKVDLIKKKITDKIQENMADCLFKQQQLESYSTFRQQLDQLN